MDNLRSLDFFISRNNGCSWRTISAQASASIMVLCFRNAVNNNGQFPCRIDTSVTYTATDARVTPTKITRLMPTPVPNRNHNNRPSSSGHSNQATTSTRTPRRNPSLSPVLDFNDSSGLSAPTPALNASTPYDRPVRNLRTSTPNDNNGRQRGASIFFSNVTSNVPVRPLATEHGFVFPIHWLPNDHLIYRAHGWLADPRFRKLIPGLQSGRLYASVQMEMSTNRNYYMISDQIPPSRISQCIILADHDRFVVFAPISGTSRFPTLYKCFSTANVKKQWIQLARKVNLFLLGDCLPKNAFDIANMMLQKAVSFTEDPSQRFGDFPIDPVGPRNNTF